MGASARTYRSNNSDQNEQEMEKPMSFRATNSQHTHEKGGENGDDERYPKYVLSIFTNMLDENLR